MRSDLDRWLILENACQVLGGVPGSLHQDLMELLDTMTDDEVANMLKQNQ